MLNSFEILGLTAQKDIFKRERVISALHSIVVCLQDSPYKLI